MLIEKKTTDMIKQQQPQTAKSTHNGSSLYHTLAQWLKKGPGLNGYLTESRVNALWISGPPPGPHQMNCFNRQHLNYANSLRYYRMGRHYRRKMVPHVTRLHVMKSFR